MLPYLFSAALSLRRETAATQQHSANNNGGGFTLSLNSNYFLSFSIQTKCHKEITLGRCGRTAYSIRLLFHLIHQPLGVIVWTEKKEKKEWRWMTSCCGERPGETEGLAPKESSSISHLHLERRQVEEKKRRTFFGAKKEEGTRLYPFRLSLTAAGKPKENWKTTMKS